MNYSARCSVLLIIESGIGIAVVVFLCIGLGLPASAIRDRIASATRIPLGEPYYIEPERDICKSPPPLFQQRRSRSHDPSGRM